MTTEQIEQVATQFQAGDFPAKEWTHQAHLAAALWFLNRYDFAEATYYLKTSLIIYHYTQGGKHNMESGYHETLTQFWMWAVATFLQENNHRQLSLEDQLQALLKSKWADKHLPMQFYSKAYLFAPDGRAFWLEPDIQPLPPTPQF